MDPLTLLVSHSDPASVSMGNALLEELPWEREGRFGGLPVLCWGNLRRVEIEGDHLFEEEIGERLEREGFRSSAILVLSRHRSKSNTPSLTVHPVGNWGDPAEFGGRPRRFSPAPAHLMAHLLRLLSKEARSLGFDVTYESTHHGPWTTFPLAYVEIGSTPKEWNDPNVAQVVARALGRLPIPPPPQGPVALGVGGGHYAPYFRDLALRGEVALAHILPSRGVATALTSGTIPEAIRSCPTITHYVVDRRLDPEDLLAAEEILRKEGLLRWE